MNRCHRPTPKPPPLYAALTLACALVAGFGAASQALAQDDLEGQVQNEATKGGRHFPEGTLRGRLTVVAAPEIRLDGQPDRLSPGARIRSAQNMVVTTGAITGQNLLVNYTRDAAGLVREVWILTPTEASVARASVERPFLNFWPFVAASQPRDDGKTPFDQLPKFGE